MKRRKELKDLIIANSNLTYNNYWRLVALASVDFCFTVPLGICSIVLNTKVGIRPWVSWDDTHWGYSRVDLFPRVVADQAPFFLVGLRIRQWSTVLCAFIFFGFFGFADEAMKNYRLLGSTVAKRLGYEPSTPNSPQDQLPAMKFFVDEVLQTPESVLDLPSVRRSSATDRPESVHPDGALDQV